MIIIIMNLLKLFSGYDFGVQAKRIGFLLNL